MKKTDKVNPVDLYRKFASQARHEGGRYLIECKGSVLVADTPRQLFEKYKKKHEA